MAITKKKKIFKVLQNPELHQVVRGFVPVFGSGEDLNIAMKLMDLHKLLESVDNEILRGSNKTKLTKKMKDILFLESGLIHSITRRNMDF